MSVVEVTHAIGEGHAPGSDGHAYELNYYYRITGEMAKYQEQLSRLFPDGLTEQDLPSVDSTELPVNFFDLLKNAYKQFEVRRQVGLAVERQRAELLELLATATHAKPVVEPRSVKRTTNGYALRVVGGENWSPGE